MRIVWDRGPLRLYWSFRHTAAPLGRPNHTSAYDVWMIAGWTNCVTAGCAKLSFQSSRRIRRCPTDSGFDRMRRTREAVIQDVRESLEVYAALMMLQHHSGDALLAALYRKELGLRAATPYCSTAERYELAADAEVELFGRRLCE